jgi:hypothetical protein
MKSRLRVLRRGCEQRLVKEWVLFGVPVARITKDREDIPQHVPLLVGCFGDTGGWVSKFAPFNRRGIKP